MDKLTGRQDFIMGNGPKIALALLLAAAVLAVYVSHGLDFALTGKAAMVVPKEEGKAYVNLSFSPENPKVLEKMEVKAAVGAQKNDDFFLEIIIVAEDGKETKRHEYRFSLGEGDDTTFTMTHTPMTIYKRSIVANLYNSNKTILYDYKVVGYKAQSDIGPFDIETELPTNFVPTGKDLPVTIKMKNFGAKGVDVNLAIDIFCFDAPDIERSLFLFVNASDELEKDLVLPTCNEEGQHRIRASLSSGDIEEVSSKAQYFEKNGLQLLDYLVPDAVTVEENSSREISIVYSNNNNADLTDIKPVVFGIPSSWLTVTPSFIHSMNRGESVVVIVKFSAPEKSMGTYPIIVGASGDNLFSQRVIELKVTGASIMTVLARETGKMPYIQIILSIAAIAIIVVFAVKRRRKPTFSYKLGKIKGEIRR